RLPFHPPIGPHVPPPEHWAGRPQPSWSGPQRIWIVLSWSRNVQFSVASWRHTFVHEKPSAEPGGPAAQPRIESSWGLLRARSAGGPTLPSAAEEGPLGTTTSSRSLPSIMTAMRHHVLSLLSVVAVCLGLAVAFVMTTTPLYSSTATLLLSPAPGNPLTAEETASTARATVAMETEAGLVTTPTL